MNDWEENDVRTGAPGDEAALHGCWPPTGDGSNHDRFVISVESNFAGRANSRKFASLKLSATHASIQ